ncbi:hypothetical protein DAMA08_041600 [Martiniozyma asiatica (nom. inval.)]|nr:hypothetical protein DAMA08_041600 [Martiniozyma asiatica]
MIDTAAIESRLYGLKAEVLVYQENNIENITHGILKEVEDFKRWLTELFNRENMPPYLVRKYTDQIAAIEGSLSGDWKRRRELKFSDFSIRPISNEETGKGKQTQILTTTLAFEKSPVFDNGKDFKVYEEINGVTIPSAEARVIVVRNVDQIISETLSSHSLQLSNISNSIIEFKNYNTYAQELTNTKLMGTSRQIRLHNLSNCVIDVHGTIVLENCTNLIIHNHKDCHLQEFHRPTESTGESTTATSSFKWCSTS